MSLETFENIERRIGGTIVENLSTPLEDCEYSETISDIIPELEETAERLETVSSRVSMGYCAPWKDGVQRISQSGRAAQRSTAL